MPRCRQNASRFNPLASNSATSDSTSLRLRRLRATPNSLMNQVHHQTQSYNRVRYSDGYAQVTSRFDNSRLLGSPAIATGLTILNAIDAN